MSIEEMGIESLGLEFSDPPENCIAFQDEHTRLGAGYLRDYHYVDPEVLIVTTIMVIPI